MKTSKKSFPKVKVQIYFFVMDFEVMAGKERSQKVLYELIRQRFAEGMLTIVFSTRNVFDEEAYMIQMKILFELTDKFEIYVVCDVYKYLFKRKISCYIDKIEMAIKICEEKMGTENKSKC